MGSQFGSRRGPGLKGWIYTEMVPSTWWDGLGGGDQEMSVLMWHFPLIDNERPQYNFHDTCFYTCITLNVRKKNNNNNMVMNENLLDV